VPPTRRALARAPRVIRRVAHLDLEDLDPERGGALGDELTEALSQIQPLCEQILDRRFADSRSQRELRRRSSAGRDQS
jgi:hypothetical protein